MRRNGSRLEHQTAVSPRVDRLVTIAVDAGQAGRTREPGGAGGPEKNTSP